MYLEVANNGLDWHYVGIERALLTPILTFSKMWSYLKATSSYKCHDQVLCVF